MTKFDGDVIFDGTTQPIAMTYGTVSQVRMIATFKIYVNCNAHLMDDKIPKFFFYHDVLLSFLLN